MLPSLAAFLLLPVPDLSTPEATIRTFVRAAGERDRAGMAACVQGGGNPERPLEPTQRLDLRVATLFVLPEGESGAVAAVEYTMGWPDPQKPKEPPTFRSSHADVLHLRKEGESWRIVPPPKVGPRIHLGNLLRAEVDATAYAQPPTPEARRRAEAEARSRAADRRRRDLSERADRARRMQRAGGAVVLWAKRHGGRLPKGQDEVRKAGLLLGTDPAMLNPRLYGKPLAALPKSGVVLAYRTYTGRPVAEPDGTFLVVLYRGGRVEAGWLSPSQAKAYGLDGVERPLSGLRGSPIPAFLLLGRPQDAGLSTPEGTVRAFVRAVGERDRPGMAACVAGGRTDEGVATGDKRDLAIGALHTAPGGGKAAYGWRSSSPTHGAGASERT